MSGPVGKTIIIITYRKGKVSNSHRQGTSKQSMDTQQYLKIGLRNNASWEKNNKIICSDRIQLPGEERLLMTV